MVIVRWCLLVGAVLLAMLTASLLADSYDWPAAARWAMAREAQWQREAGECPVLLGRGCDGCSRTGYLEAARLAAGVDAAGSRRLRELADAPVALELTAADRTELAALAPAVAALRAAAHCAGPSAAASFGEFAVFDFVRTADALLVEARERSRAGAVADAVPLLLDALAAGVDLANGAVAIEVAVGAFTLERAVDRLDDALLRGADPALLARLAEALAVADGALPVRSPMVPHLAIALVRRLQGNAVVTPDELGMATPLLAFRHGFSVRAFGRARATQLVAMVARFEDDEVGQDPRWPARRQRLARLAAAERASNWDLRWGFLDHIVEQEEQLREAATKLRLLRLAVAFHLGQSLPKLADPLGAGDFAVSPTGSGVSFASADPALVRACVRGR